MYAVRIQRQNVWMIEPGDDARFILQRFELARRHVSRNGRELYSHYAPGILIPGRPDI
jgi:hypothetical protein